MKINALLVSSGKRDYWQDKFTETAGRFGLVMTCTEVEAAGRLADQAFNLVVIDATTVPAVNTLIEQFRQVNSTIPIIVVTLAPTWKNARDAFSAGATDYLRKSVEREEIETLLRGAVRN